MGLFGKWGRPATRSSVVCMRRLALAVTGQANEENLEMTVQLGGPVTAMPMARQRAGSAEAAGTDAPTSESGVMATAKTEATDQDISTTEVAFTLAVSGVECVAGVLGNGFIVALHAAQWAGGRRLPTADHILLQLSLSRLLLQIWMTLENVYSLLLRATYNQNPVYVLFKVVLTFLNFFNIWLAAWLNVFYCVRIAHFSHPWFHALRRSIGALMPWLLRLSLLVSLGCSFAFSKDTFHVHVNSSAPVAASNATERRYFAATNVANLFLQLWLGVSVPLAVFLLAAALLIVSLRRHTLRLRRHAAGSGDPGTEAHVGAIRATSCFLVLYVFNAVALYLSMANTFEPDSPWSVLCKVVMGAYPAGHSVLLILGNPGLRRAWARCRHQARLRLRGWKP